MSLDNKKIDDLIKKSIDLHFHVGPDILPRKYTVEQLIESEAGKIRGVALKAHSFPTITSIDAAVKNHGQTGVELIGSITLNYFMGGFNPSAVYASSMLSRDYPIIVWFPTIHAENHLIHNHSEYEIPPEWIGDPYFKPRTKDDLKAIKVTNWAGRLIRKANLVLDEMVKNNCILATGHISWREAERLTLDALDRGLKVLVTHPMQKDISMPLEVQRKLADKGAFIEYCYIMYLDRDHPGDYPPEKQVEAIKEIGADQCILVSDGGQVRNPSPSKCLKDYVNLLSPYGLGEGDFKTMLVDNPLKLLGK
ncbi:MAG: hypothetical protein GF334_08350 [Candidatus Altiarchaeales archaeon]|nr:hypothetical protein [Candidatus Altiarchaeales archaeon]